MYPHFGSLHLYQGNVQSELFVGWPVVLHDVRSGVHGAEKGVVVLPRDQLFDDLDSLGALFDVLVEFDIVEEKVVNVPLSSVDALVAHPIFRFDGADPTWPSVRLKPSLRPQVHQLFSYSWNMLFQFF